MGKTGELMAKSVGFKKSWKKFFSNRRNVIWVIVVVSLLILTLIKVLVWQIYTNDEPKIVPEDVRGEVRKNVEDAVENTVSKVAPGLGQAIIDASFDNKMAGNDAPDSGLLIYRSPIGFSLSYPQNWSFEDGIVPAIVPNGSAENGIFLYNNTSELTPSDWWEQTKNRYSTTYTVTVASINGRQVVKAVETGGLGEIHYIFRQGDTIVDAVVIGDTITGDKIIQTLN